MRPSSGIFAMLPFVVGALGTTIEPTPSNPNPQCIACPWHDTNGNPIVLSLVSPPGLFAPGLLCGYEQGGLNSGYPLTGCSYSTADTTAETPTATGCQTGPALSLAFDCPATLKGSAAYAATNVDGIQIACINASGEFCLYNPTTGVFVPLLGSDNNVGCPASIAQSQCYSTLLGVITSCISQPGGLARQNWNG